MKQTRKLEEVRSRRYRDLELVKRRNIVDMALGFSAMMRLFETGSKELIQSEILKRLPVFFTATSEDEFKATHRDFCLWGMKEIKRAERELNGEIVRKTAPASYGQIAKTLDIVLHVIIHYAHRPDPETAKILSKWLNPAMDTKMMAFVAGCYPDVLKPWPKTIEQVKETDYNIIQLTVRQFIKEEHKSGILPIDFDDIYWEVLNQSS